MTDDLMPCQTIRRPGAVEGRLTLDLDAPPSEVWRHLTDSERLGAWLAPGRIEPKAGGRAWIDFGQSGMVIDSAVTYWQPGERLGYDWSAGQGGVRPLVFELTPTDAGVRLLLTARVPEGEEPARALAGWACHLEMLAAAIAGVPISFPMSRFKAYRQAYADQLQPA